MVVSGECLTGTSMGMLYIPARSTVHSVDCGPPCSAARRPGRPISSRVVAASCRVEEDSISSSSTTDRDENSVTASTGNRRRQSVREWADFITPACRSTAVRNGSETICVCRRHSLAGKITGWSCHAAPRKTSRPVSGGGPFPSSTSPSVCVVYVGRSALDAEA